MHYCSSNVIMRSEWRGGYALFSQGAASISTLNKLNGSRQQMQSGIYHQLFMFFFSTLYLCLHLSRSTPPTLGFTQGCAQAYTLAVRHTVAASTEELHECTHNCLFFLTETSTLATQSKMAPSVLFISVVSLQGNIS